MLSPTVNPESKKDPIKRNPKKELICIKRIFENSGVKLFVPLCCGLLVPAKPKNLQICFSKTT